jgi:hypothetical protein
MAKRLSKYDLYLGMHAQYVSISGSSHALDFHQIASSSALWEIESDGASRDERTPVSIDFNAWCERASRLGQGLSNLDCATSRQTTIPFEKRRVRAGKVKHALHRACADSRFIASTRQRQFDEFNRHGLDYSKRGFLLVFPSRPRAPRSSGVLGRTEPDSESQFRVDQAS